MATFTPTAIGAIAVLKRQLLLSTPPNDNCGGLAPACRYFATSATWTAPRDRPRITVPRGIDGSLVYVVGWGPDGPCPVKVTRVFQETDVGGGLHFGRQLWVIHGGLHGIRAEWIGGKSDPAHPDHQGYAFILTDDAHDFPVEVRRVVAW